MRSSPFKVRLLLAAVAFLAAGLGSAAIAAGATYYVSTTGSDTNPGTLTQPFRSIRKGLSVMVGGDTLLIRGGVYNEIILGWDIRGGSAGAPTVVSGYQNENPIIRCDYPCGEYGISITLFSSYITIRNLTIDNINARSGGSCLFMGPSNIIVDGVTCLNAARDGFGGEVGMTNNTIRNSQIKDCGRVQPPGDIDTKGIGIHINPGDNVTIEWNLIEGCRGGGIAVHQSADPGPENVVVRYNVLRNFGTRSSWQKGLNDPPLYGTGITMAHGIGKRYIYGNLVYGVRGETALGARGQCFLVWAGGAGDRGDSANYLWYNNTCYDADVGAELWNDARIHDQSFRNNIFANVTTVHLGPFGVNNNVNQHYVTNPTFKNAAAGDFSLVAGSAGIDQGVTPPFPIPLDLNGTSRPQGCCYDIGAYEYRPEATPVQPSPPQNLSIILP